MEPAIVPSPDVRTVIDKTVVVIKQGEESTAQRLLLAKPRLFSFLNPADPFYEWYQWRLNSEEEAAGDEQLKQEQKRQVEVDPLMFSVDQPAISSKYLQVIKLTALYTSQDPEFPQALPEQDQFAFLVPTHSLHGLFKAYVDQYTILKTPDKVAGLLSANVLEKAADRAEELKLRNEQAKIELEKQEQERTEFSRIDWQDFVVIETVEFLDSDKIDNRPLRKEDVQVKALQPKNNELQLRSPYTGELIPASEFDKHMRIMNLDPTWKQQRDVARQRQATTNLDTSQAASNLKRMMAAKNDAPRKRR